MKGKDGMPDLISIIVPVYNCEQYIDTAIESLCKQTYKNIEIIVVDDGSTDSTLQRASGYAEKDSRVKIITKKNGGVSSARNVGLRCATGSVIGFVDGDDCCDPKQYETMYNALVSHGADASICSLCFEYPGRSWIQKGAYMLGSVMLMEQERVIREMYEGTAFSGHVHNKLFRREVLEDIWFDEDIAICEDTLFCLRAFERCRRVVYIAEPLYHYYIRQTSAFHQQNFEKLYSAHISYQRMEQELEEKRVSQNVLRSFAIGRHAMDLNLLMNAIGLKLTSDRRYWEIRREMRKCYFIILPALRIKQKILYGIAAVSPRVYCAIINAKKKWKNK